MSDANKEGLIPKRRLGQGLDGLLGPRPAAAAPSAPPPSISSQLAFHAPIEEVHPNRAQPRTRFEDTALNELADSIRELGVLEPILVRKRTAAGGSGYEIIAGERRWRAAQRAGLREVPVFVRELNDEAAFEAALVENLQREDLNPLETARAFNRLLEEHNHTQESLAQRIGKDRSAIANTLRLLKLPEVVAQFIENGQLSEGHGRALLGAHDVPTMAKLAKEAVEKNWSVRETERAARAAAAAKSKPRVEPAVANPNLRDLESKLTKSLGSNVSVADRKGKGHITIAFTNYDELDRLLEKLL